METTGQESNAVYMPPELLAQVREAAKEEHRDTHELVSDAVRRYLEERNRDTSTAPPKKRLSELFSALRGVDIDLSRNPSTGRAVDL